jgi:ABC-type multidrug transport system fused ATPase/permease subunit
VQNRTVLVIAHRYNTIAHAEQIAVLEDGKLVEVGQPALLRQRDGPYSRFIEACRKV